MRYVLILIGLLFTGLAVLGIVMPGLPATPFLLLASAAFIKSSPRLYKWLIGHSLFGPLLKDFAEKKGISAKNKTLSIILIWLMIAVSLIFFIEDTTAKWIVAACGLIGTTIMLLIKTVR